MDVFDTSNEIFCGTWISLSPLVFFMWTKKKNDFMRLNVKLLTSSPLPSSPSAGGPAGSRHPGQGERRSSSDWCRGGRRRAWLPRADENHDGGARSEKWATEGCHSWWQTWPVAEHQHQTLPVRTLSWSAASSQPHVGNILAKLIKLHPVPAQRVWNQWESGGSRSGYAASNARPAALQCNYLLTFKCVPWILWLQEMSSM